MAVKLFTVSQINIISFQGTGSNFVLGLAFLKILFRVLTTLVTSHKKIADTYFFFQSLLKIISIVLAIVNYKLYKLIIHKSKYCRISSTKEIFSIIIPLFIFYILLNKQSIVYLLPKLFLKCIEMYLQ